MTCLQDTYYWLQTKRYENGWLKEGSDGDYTIIHALVERWGDGLRHPHAVIYNKKTGNIHEVSNSYKNNNSIMPFKLWILAGKISDIKQYDFMELNSKMLETKEWNFYHLKEYLDEKKEELLEKLKQQQASKQQDPAEYPQPHP